MDPQPWPWHYCTKLDGADLWQAERQADKMAEYDGYDGFSCAPW